MDWYKRFPDKYLAGTQFLTLEERGAYSTLIDLQYARHGWLPDNERAICEYLACRPQTWRRLRQALIDKGKLHIQPDGFLTANGVQRTMEREKKSLSSETGTKPTVKSPVSPRFQKNSVEIKREFGPRSRIKNLEEEKMIFKKGGQGGQQHSDRYVPLSEQGNGYVSLEERGQHPEQLNQLATRKRA